MPSDSPQRIQILYTEKFSLPKRVRNIINYHLFTKNWLSPFHKELTIPLSVHAVFWTSFTWKKIQSMHTVVWQISRHISNNSKATTEHLKLSTNKHFNLFQEQFSLVLQCYRIIKKCNLKKQDHTEELQSIHQAAW